MNKDSQELTFQPELSNTAKLLLTTPIPESSQPILTETTPSPSPQTLCNPYDQDNIDEILAFKLITEPEEHKIIATVGSTPRFSTIPREAPIDTDKLLYIEPTSVQDRSKEAYQE